MPSTVPCVVVGSFIIVQEMRDWPPGAVKEAYSLKFWVGSGRVAVVLFVA